MTVASGSLLLLVTRTVYALRTLPSVIRTNSGCRS